MTASRITVPTSATGSESTAESSSVSAIDLRLAAAVGADAGPDLHDMIGFRGVVQHDGRPFVVPRRTIASLIGSLT